MKLTTPNQGSPVIEVHPYFGISFFSKKGFFLKKISAKKKDYLISFGKIMI